MVNKIIDRRTKKEKSLLIISFVFLFISLAVVLSSIGKEYVSPFEFEAAWDNPNIIVKENNKDLKLVSDRYAKRLSVVEDGMVIAQNFISNNAMPVDNLLHARVYDNSFYIHGSVLDDSCSTILDEKIIHCSHLAEYKETIFSLSQLNIDLDRSQVHICDFSIDDNDDLYLTIKDEQNILVYKIEFDYRGNFTSSIIANHKLDLNVYNAYYVVDEQKIVVNDYVDNTYQIDLNSNNVSEGADFSYSPSQINTTIDSSSKYNVIYYLRNLIKWITLLYIFIFIVVLVLMFVKTQWSQLKKGLIKKSFLVLCVFVTIIVISLFYNNIIYNQMKETACSDLETMADICVNDVDVHAVDNAESVLNNDNLSEEAYIDNVISISQDLRKTADKIQKSVINSNKGISYYLYLNDYANDVFVPFADGKNNMQIAYNVDLYDTSVSNEVKNQGYSSGELEDYLGKYLYYAKAFYNSSGQLRGCYLFSLYTKAIDAAFYNNVGILTFFLIAISLILYALIREAENIYGQIVKFINKKKQKNKLSYLQLIRPLSFFLSLAIGADTAIAVLISKELFEISLIKEQIDSLGLADLFISLPIVVAGLSLVLGIVLFSKLELKFTSRSIFRWGSILLIFSFIFMVFAISQSSFVLFTISKFFSGLLIGILRAELYSFAILEKDEKSRHPLVSSIGRTGMPASVISAIICGWSATTFGNQSIYVFAVLSIVLYYIVGSFIIPRGVYFIKQNKNKSSVKSTVKQLSSLGIVKWLLSPQILVLILFVMVPYTTAGGYKSYLFPLYTQEIGFDKTQISILFSLATALAFILVHPFSTIYNNFDNRNRIIIGLSMLGFIYVLFMFNRRVEWAVVVMVLTLVSQRVFGTSFRMSWVRHCEYHNIDRSQLQPVMYFIEELLKAMQVVFFAIFFILGGNFACVVFGIFCFIGVIIFTLVSHNSPLRKGWH